MKKCQKTAVTPVTNHYTFNMSGNTNGSYNLCLFAPADGRNIVHNPLPTAAGGLPTILPQTEGRPEAVVGRKRAITDVSGHEDA